MGRVCSRDLEEKYKSLSEKDSRIKEYTVLKCFTDAKILFFRERTDVAEISNLFVI